MKTLIIAMTCALSFSAMANVTMDCTLNNHVEGKVYKMEDVSSPFRSGKMTAESQDFFATATASQGGRGADNKEVNSYHLMLVHKSSGMTAQSQGKLVRSQSGTPERFEKPMLTMGDERQLLASIECRVR